MAFVLWRKRPTWKVWMLSAFSCGFKIAHITRVNQEVYMINTYFPSNGNPDPTYCDTDTDIEKLKSMLQVEWNAVCNVIIKGAKTTKNK